MTNTNYNCAICNDWRNTQKQISWNRVENPIFVKSKDYPEFGTEYLKTRKDFYTEMIRVTSEFEKHYSNDIKFFKGMVAAIDTHIPKPCFLVD